MHLKDNFEVSFNELRDHKIIILPILISMALSMLLISSFFYISGISDVVKEFSSPTEGFLEERQQEADMTNTIKGLMSAKNIILFIIFIIFLIIVSFYLSCMSYALITLNIKKRKLTISNAFSFTNQFFWKLLAMKILLILIFLVPSLLAILLVIFSFLVNVRLGIVFTFLFLITMVTYWVFLGLRLFFPMAVLFIDNKTAVGSIKESYKITKHRLKHVFVIFIIILGISVLINMITSAPIQESFSTSLSTNSIIKFVFAFLILIFFLILNSFMIMFERMFFFYSYLDFKKGAKK